MESEYSWKRAVINALANCGYLAGKILLTLLYVPLLVRFLGAESYGFLVLSLSFSVYATSFLTSSNGAIKRFLAAQFSYENSKSTGQLFSSALAISLKSVVPSIALFGIWILLQYFGIIEIPEKDKSSALFLALAIFGASVLSGIAAVFSSVAYATNRFDYMGAPSMVCKLLEMVLVSYAFRFGDPRTWIVGAAMFVGAIAELMLAILLARRALPEVSFWPDWNKIRQNKIKKMAGWLFIEQIGVTAFHGADMALANNLLPLKVGGILAILKLWYNMIISVLPSLVTTLGPTITQKYVIHGTESTARFTLLTCRYIGLILGVLVGLLCGFSVPLFRQWIVKTVIPDALLVGVMLGPLVWNLATLPMLSVQIAANSVKWLAIISVVAAFGKMLLAWVFIRKYEMGLMGIALANSIALSFKCVIFAPLYTARVLNHKNLVDFFTPVLPGVTVFAVTTSWGVLLSKHFELSTWPLLLLGMGAVGCGSVAFAAIFIPSRILGDIVIHGSRKLHSLISKI